MSVYTRRAARFEKIYIYRPRPASVVAQHVIDRQSVRVPILRIGCGSIENFSF